MMKDIWNTIDYYLEKREFIITLIVINFLGSIYGFYWYKNQLLASPKHLLIFVADSPLATLFFTAFLVYYLFNKKVPILEALASITLFKYGIWAASIIIWGAWRVEPSVVKILMVDTITWIDVLLIISHLGMALEAVIFFRKYTYKFPAILLVSLWVFGNDILDYTLDIYPWLPQSLNSIDYTVGKFTLILSGTTIFIFYILTLVRRKFE